MAKAAPAITKPDELFDSFITQQQKEAQTLTSGNRVTFASLRIGQVKEKKGVKSVVEVINPLVRDDSNNPQVTQFEELRVVALAHVMIRRLRFTNAQNKLRTELFSVGPKRPGWAVGTAIGGVMQWDDVIARYPEGFERDHIPYNSDTVTRGHIKPESRYYAVFGLPEEAREAAGSDIAFAGLSMSSTYGIMVEKVADAEDLSNTLLAYPHGDDPEKHKGVFHKLLTRPWEAALAAGVPEDNAKGTPQSAIWLSLFGTHIGDTPTAVHAFEIADELTREELAWSREAQVRARDLMCEIIEQETRDAYPNFNATRLPQLSEAAVEERWEDVGQVLRQAVPVNAEIVEDEGVEADSEDLGTATVQAPPPDIDDQFPPEDSLPF